MAVQACTKPKLMEDYDDFDDDAPIVFKRKNATKKTQSNPEVKKSSSQRNDGIQGRQVSEVRSSNGQNSNTQKGKTTAVPSANASSPVKSPIVSRKPSSVLSPKMSPVTSPLKNSKPSTSAADQSKHSSQHNVNSTVVKEEKLSIKPAEDNSEDSDEDHKPISFRLSAGSSKVNSNNAKKGPGVSSTGSPPVQKPRVVKHEDVDDESPLSARFPVKSNNAASTSKAFDSDVKKPLASKVQQNGSANIQLKTSSSVLKRPIGEVKSLGQSSVKKPKLSDTSTPINSKQVSAKAEPKTGDSDDGDDSDHVPISQRMKKPAASDGKSSSAKQKVTKVTKVISPPFKKTSKSSKKVMKNSTYSKSLRVPPGSGEGQKWTTLVHNGVIFPPPYKPHGVKMLYKGQPVDLTSEQEEVNVSLSLYVCSEYRFTELPFI